MRNTREKGGKHAFRVIHRSVMGKGLSIQCSEFVQQEKVKSLVINVSSTVQLFEEHGKHKEQLQVIGCWRKASYLFRLGASVITGEVQMKEYKHLKGKEGAREKIILWTESQNRRVWKGPLKTESNPTAKTKFPRVGWAVKHTSRSWISPEKKTPGPSTGKLKVVLEEEEQCFSLSSKKGLRTWVQDKTRVQQNERRLHILLEKVMRLYRTPKKTWMCRVAEVIIKAMELRMCDRRGWGKGQGRQQHLGRKVLLGNFQHKYICLDKRKFRERTSKSTKARKDHEAWEGPYTSKREKSIQIAEELWRAHVRIQSWCTATKKLIEHKMHLHWTFGEDGQVRTWRGILATATIIW